MPLRSPGQLASTSRAYFFGSEGWGFDSLRVARQRSSLSIGNFPAPFVAVLRDLCVPRFCLFPNPPGMSTSLHRCQAARELGLDLFGATLSFGSIVVDPGELHLHAVDHAVATFDHSVIVCSVELIDCVLVELDFLDLGVDRRSRRFEGVEPLAVGAVTRRSTSSCMVPRIRAISDCRDQGQGQQQLYRDRLLLHW